MTIVFVLDAEFTIRYITNIKFQKPVKNIATVNKKAV